MRHTKRSLARHREALEKAQVGGWSLAARSLLGAWPAAPLNLLPSLRCCQAEFDAAEVLCVDCISSLPSFFQAEYDAAKAKWEEEKKLGKATPSKEAAKERRLSDVASEWPAGFVRCFLQWQHSFMQHGCQMLRLSDIACDQLAQRRLLAVPHAHMSAAAPTGH